MEAIRDKCIIFLCCMIFVIFHIDNVLVIEGMIFCIIAGGLQEFFENEKITTFLSLLYFIGMIFFDPLVFFFPVIIYRWFYEKQWLYAAASILIFGYAVREIDFYSIWVLVMLITVSGVMAHHSKRYITLKEVYLRQKDDSRELEILLKQMNKDLIDKQLTTIHIATLKERNRIAREIHDNVGHMLSRSILQVGALLVIEKEEMVKGQLEALQATLDEAMNSIRNSVHNLHDQSLDMKQELTNMLSHYEQYTINLDYDFPEQAPKEVKYCFICITKEALSNVVKHSNADKINLIVRKQPAFYQMMFEDNGSNYEKKSYTGIGLSDIRERVEALNGIFNIRTESGFRIFVSIPLKQADI